MKLVDLDNLGIAKADIEILGNASYVYGWNSALQVVAETSHIVDPETLPLVQELRKQLAQVTAERNAFKSNPPVEIKSDAFELAMQLTQVTAERDAAVKLCGKLIALCSPPKEWESKLFRRKINRPGDYMGCGYAFFR